MMTPSVAAALLAVLLLLCIALRLSLALARERAENRRLRGLLSLPGGKEDLEALRRLRHDLRHYLLTAGETVLAAEDLEAMRATLDTPLDLSSPGPVSALAAYYRREAQALGVQADILLDCEGESGELLPDLCLLLSNLLENAVEALRREGGGWLRVRSVTAEGYISLVVGNACSAPPRRIQGGWLSRKADGRRGEGLSTVEDIARKHGGSVEFTCADGEFRASVFLPRPAEVRAGDGTVKGMTP